jgi:hypothetical protein
MIEAAIANVDANLSVIRFPLPSLCRARFPLWQSPAVSISSAHPCFRLHGLAHDFERQLASEDISGQIVPTHAAERTFRDDPRRWHRFDRGGRSTASFAGYGSRPIREALIAIRRPQKANFRVDGHPEGVNAKNKGRRRRMLRYLWGKLLNAELFLYRFTVG